MAISVPNAKKAVLTLVVARAIVIPAVLMTLVVLFCDRVISEDSSDRALIKLVLMIEAAVPAADTIIVVCQQSGQVRTAETLAASYFGMYLLGMAPLAAAIAISMNTFF